jgi:nitric oxide reductase large subunit
MPPPAPDIRRLLLQLVLRVLAVHAVAIALYYAAGLARAGQHIRLAFVTVWMALTLAVVLPSLLRIRRARGAAQRTPRKR